MKEQENALTDLLEFAASMIPCRSPREPERSRSLKEPAPECFNSTEIPFAKQVAKPGKRKKNK